MSYDYKIKQLELQYEALGLRIKNMEPGEDVAQLENSRLEILERIRMIRRLQYDSQFVMNDDDYEY